MHAVEALSATMRLQACRCLEDLEDASTNFTEALQLGKAVLPSLQSTEHDAELMPLVDELTGHIQRRHQHVTDWMNHNWATHCTLTDTEAKQNINTTACVNSFAVTYLDPVLHNTYQHLAKFLLRFVKSVISRNQS